MHIILVVLACTVGAVFGSTIRLDVRDRSSITLPCYYTGNTRLLEWYVTTVIHPELYDNIYSIEGLIAQYETTGRYQIFIGNGWYNLSISNISIFEVGMYHCGCSYTNILTYSVNIVSFDDVDAYTTHSTVSIYESNSSVTLNCNTTLPLVSWMYIGNTTIHPRKIDNDVVKHRGLLLLDCNEYPVNCKTLIIPNARSIDTGYYFCIEELREGILESVRQHLFDVRVLTVPSPSTIRSNITTDFDETTPVTVSTELVIHNSTGTTTSPISNPSQSCGYPITTVALLSVAVAILLCAVIVLGTCTIRYRTVIISSRIRRHLVRS